MKRIKIYFFTITVLLIFKISYTENFSPLVFNGKQKFIYKVRVKDNVYTEITEYKKESLNGKLYFSYISTGDYTSTDKYIESGTHRWEVCTDAKGMPAYVNLYSGNNGIWMKFDGNGNVDYNIKWNNKTAGGRKNFKANVSFENALIVRTLDFNRNDNYIFDLIQSRELPDIEAYEMYFKVIGTTKVSVKAGTFNCRKILFSLTGYKGFFYKAYYYVTDDADRYIVKIENIPVNGSSELIAIE